MTRHTHRYHLLCAREGAAAAQKALDAALPEWVLLVDLDDEPGLSGASGQWTEEEATALLHVVEEIPGLKAWRGPPLGVVEAGVVVVDKGGDASRQGDLRFTVAKAIEEEKATLQQKAKRLQPWSKVVRTLLLLLDHRVCSRDERMGRQRVAEAERGTQGDPPQGDRQGAAGESLADAG